MVHPPPSETWTGLSCARAADVHSPRQIANTMRLVCRIRVSFLFSYSAPAMPARAATCREAKPRHAQGLPLFRGGRHVRPRYVVVPEDLRNAGVSSGVSGRTKAPPRSKAINNFGDEALPAAHVAIIGLIPPSNADSQPARSRRCVQADGATRRVIRRARRPSHGIATRCPGSTGARSIAHTESGPVAGTA